MCKSQAGYVCPDYGKWILLIETDFSLDSVMANNLTGWAGWVSRLNVLYTAQRPLTRPTDGCSRLAAALTRPGRRGGRGAPAPPAATRPTGWSGENTGAQLLGAATRKLQTSYRHQSLTLMKGNLCWFRDGYSTRQESILQCWVLAWGL